MFTILQFHGYSTDVLPVSTVRSYLGRGERSENCVYIHSARAGVAELADAQDLGSCGLKTVEVQVLSPAPWSASDYLFPFKFALSTI